MKRFAFVVGLVVLVFAVSLRAQTTTPKPGPEHQKVGIFVGHWTYESEYKAGPWGPSSKATGEYNAQLILGGFFLQAHWVEKGASGVQRGFEVFGYNPATKDYFQSQYADDGSMMSGEISVSGSTWNYSGWVSMAGKAYRIKVTMIFAADLMSMALQGELSPDGISWMPFWVAKFTKVKPAPKK